jgi:hypothetical protein
MMQPQKNKIFKTFATGTLKKKSYLLEEIRETRDVSLVSSLVDVLEKEESRNIKELILMVLGRLIPLSELRDINVDFDINRMLRSSDPFVRNSIVEIMHRSEI